jgi:hypothetical protein
MHNHAPHPERSHRADQLGRLNRAEHNEPRERLSSFRHVTKSAIRGMRFASTVTTLAFAACVGFGVTACSTSSTDLVHLPDGQSGFAVNCSGSGSGSSWAECYQRAGDACGASGYDIVSKDNDDGAAAGGGVSNIATANVKSRSMVIRCK